MKREHLFAVIFGFALASCLAFQITTPAPTSSIQGAPICNTAIGGSNGLLAYNGTNWCIGNTVSANLINGVSKVTGSSTFTTDTAISFYDVILVGAGGGGGSSSGAGFGSDGGVPCQAIGYVEGLGTAYTVTIGAGGAAGLAGAGGQSGGGTSIKVSGGSATIQAVGGAGGVVGTGSNAAAPSNCTTAITGALYDGSTPANVFGWQLASGNNIGAGTGGATPNAVFGVTAGAGCAGANCTTDTAGQNGVVWFIAKI